MCGGGDRDYRLSLRLARLVIGGEQVGARGLRIHPAGARERNIAKSGDIHRIGVLHLPGQRGRLIAEDVRRRGVEQDDARRLGLIK